MTTSNPPEGLRIVTFNVLPPAFAMISSWAAQAGHTIVLAVTTPGPSTRRMPMYRELVAKAPPEIDILVTTRLKRVALPLIRELKPDLITCMSFPYRIPAEIRNIPRFGAVNLHPAPLPAYRGPNVMRMFYDGWHELGATMHWMDDDFDTGRVLARHASPMPAAITQEAVMPLWSRAMMGAFAEGVARAVAGDPGVAQTGEPSYAAAFTDAEHVLQWDLPSAVLQRRATALNMMGAPRAHAQVEGKDRVVARIDPLAPTERAAAPGTVLDRGSTALVIMAGDGPVQVTLA